MPTKSRRTQHYKPAVEMSQAEENLFTKTTLPRQDIRGLVTVDEKKCFPDDCLHARLRPSRLLEFSFLAACRELLLLLLLLLQESSLADQDVHLQAHEGNKAI